MAPTTSTTPLEGLTEEELQKLRDFWGAVLRVFGVSGNEPGSPQQAGNGVPSLSSGRNLNLHLGNNAVIDNEEQDKKQKTGGLFGWRKAREVSPKDMAFGRRGMDDLDSEDKYAQTNNFKHALATNTPQEMHRACWNMVKVENPDALLLRFLRARNWDLERAMVMMIATLHWRINEMRVDDEILPNGEMGALKDSTTFDSAKQKEGADFMAQMRMGKTFIHGIDKQGRPICTIPVRKHKIGAQSNTSLERLTVLTFELARLMLTPPVETATLIFDMADFSIANMDYTPLKFIVKCFEAYYPDSLGVVLVHKAPWIFQGFWRIIRGWLDPAVVSKIHFTSTVEEMEQFIHRSNIPRGLGGDDDWEFEYLEPVEDENRPMYDVTSRDRLVAERSQLVRAYEHYTREWLRTAPEASASILAERTALAERLKQNYWQLDPHVRARSVYDRTGVIGKNGKIRIGRNPSKSDDGFNRLLK